MRSPFPGMDPYLEDPIGWPGVHHLLLSSIHELLASAVGPSYVVRVEERVYVTDPSSDPGYAVLVPHVIEPLLEPEIHDRTIEIRDARSHAVVAAIDLLSPANKVANSRGRLAMLKKRTLLRRAHAHWLEIDLLRAGERDPGMCQAL